MTTDSSVMTNLKDLFEMETARRVEAAAAAERAKAEAAARADAERRAREEAIAAARDEERRRGEAERAARDAETEARIRALRAQLEDVRASRKELHDRVLEIATAPTPAPSRTGSWIAGVMAAASLVAAITATTVAWPQAAQPVAVAPTPAPIVLIEEPAPTPEPAVEVVEAPAPEAPAEVAVATPAREARPSRPRPRPQARPQPDDLSHQLDLSDDDSVLSDDFLRQAGN